MKEVHYTSRDKSAYWVGETGGWRTSTSRYLLLSDSSWWLYRHQEDGDPEIIGLSGFKSLKIKSFRPPKSRKPQERGIYLHHCGLYFKWSKFQYPMDPLPGLVLVLHPQDLIHNGQLISQVLFPLI